MAGKSNETTPLKKIWEVQWRFKCPLVGLLCSRRDIGQVLKKKVTLAGKDEYTIHRIVLACIDDDNPVARRLDRLLRKRYRREIDRYARIPEDQFMDLWQQKKEGGACRSLFYLATIRSDLSDSAVEKIFGHIHMLHHKSLKTLSDIQRELDNERQARLVCDAAYRHARRQIKSMRRTICELNSSLARAGQPLLSQVTEEDLNSLEEKTRQLEDNNAALKERIEVLEKQKHDLRQAVIGLKNERKRLKRDLAALRALNRSLLFFSKGTTGSKDQPCRQCDPSCPAYADCPKRILVVGGITKISHHYRELVNSLGHEFEYHNGYTKKGFGSLVAKIKKADFIICQTDCNSHGACQTVKSYGKKFNKQILMLKGGGINNLSRAIIQSLKEFSDDNANYHIKGDSLNVISQN